jgi:hypothetical protein
MSYRIDGKGLYAHVSKALFAQSPNNQTRHAQTSLYVLLAMKYAKYGWSADEIYISGSRRNIYKNLKRKPQRKGSQTGKPNCSFFFSALKAYQQAGLLNEQGGGVALKVPWVFVDESLCMAKHEHVTDLSDEWAEMETYFRHDDKEWLWEFGHDACRDFLIIHRGYEPDKADYMLQRIAQKMGIEAEHCRGERKKPVSPKPAVVRSEDVDDF